MSTKKFQGFFFAYELASQEIRLRLFRLIPLGRIKLRDVRCMRLSARREFMDGGPQRHWPSLLRHKRGLNPLYVIVMRKGGKKYFLRLGGAFHYDVRSAIGQHKR